MGNWKLCGIGLNGSRYDAIGIIADTNNDATGVQSFEPL